MADTFEVNNIIRDRIHNGISYYLVEWKNTITTDISAFKTYKNDIKKVTKFKNYVVIEWKNTWMEFDQLKYSCDEILGAYLLIKLYKFSTK